MCGVFGYVGPREAAPILIDGQRRLHVRLAGAGDADGIGRLLSQAYNIASPEEGAEAAREEMARGIRMLVAADGAEVVGVISWLPHGLPKHGLAELDRIAVREDCRGRGVARGLFQALIADADAEYAHHGGRLRKLFLMTHADNTAAQCFYKKMGMAAEARLKSHYYDGRDEVVMSILR